MASLSEPEVLMILSHNRRRSIVRVLEEGDPPISTVELADAVGDSENGELPAAELREIYLSLNHEHLPWLMNARVIEHSDADGVVRPGVNFCDVLSELHAADQQELEWSDA